MAPATRTLFAITHTETYYNRRRIFCGQLNSHLTPRGHRQAERIGKKLKKQKIAWAFISTLARSKETLEPILEHHTVSHIVKYHPEMRVRIDKRLAERDYGKLSHKSKVVYRRKYPELYRLYHRSYEVPPPGGESMIQVEKRVLSLLREIIALIKKQKMNVLIIAHNNSIRPIRRYFEGLTPNQMMRLDNRHRIFRYKIPV